MSEEDERCGWETPEHEGVQCKVRGPHASHLLIFKVDGEQVRLLIPNESHVDAQPPVGTRPTPSSRAALREQRERIRQDATDRVAAQATALDVVESERRRAEGIARALSHSPEEFKALVSATIERLARENEYLWADMVWMYVEKSEDDNHSVGGLWTAAQARGIIENTGETVKTEQVSSNRGYITKWRSLIYEGRAQSA